MNQTGAIIEAIKFEISDEQHVLVNNMDTKESNLVTIINPTGTPINNAYNLTGVDFHSGDYINICLDNIISAEYVNQEDILQLNVGESFTRGLK